MVKDLQSRTLDIVRFPLAVMVVFIHCYGDISAETSNSIPALFYENTRILFSRILSHIAVPLFYIISGYLFFFSFKGKWSTSLWKEKMSRRLWTLLIPYIIWNIIPILLYCGSVILGAIIHQKAFCGFGEYFDKCLTWRVFWDFGSENGLAFPLNAPLWFIRDLMFNMLISPIIFGFVKIFRTYGILFFLAYYFFRWNFIAIPIVNLWTLIFFLFGAYLAINEKNMVIIARMFSPYIYILCPMMLFSALYFYESQYRGLFFRAYVLTGVITCFSLSALFVERTHYEMPKVLKDSTFFIFAAHLGLPLLPFIRKVLDYTIPNSNYYWMTVHYFLVPISLIWCCLIIYILLLKFLPRTTKFICGR